MVMTRPVIAVLRLRNRLEGGPKRTFKTTAVTGSKEPMMTSSHLQQLDQLKWPILKRPRVS